MYIREIVDILDVKKKEVAESSSDNLALECAIRSLNSWDDYIMHLDERIDYYYDKIADDPRHKEEYERVIYELNKSKDEIKDKYLKYVTANSQEKPVKRFRLLSIFK